MYMCTIPFARAEYEVRRDQNGGPQTRMGPSTGRREPMYRIEETSPGVRLKSHEISPMEVAESRPNTWLSLREFFLSGITYVLSHKMGGGDASRRQEMIVCSRRLLSCRTTATPFLSSLFSLCNVPSAKGRWERGRGLGEICLDLGCMVSQFDQLPRSCPPLGGIV